MLVVRAPLILSLAGNGTDQPDYYTRYGGAVVAASIDKYFYTFLNSSDNSSTGVLSASQKAFFYNSRQQTAGDLFWSTGPRLPQTVLRHFKLEKEQDLLMTCEVQTGDGLGAISAGTVSMVKALSQYKKISVGQKEIAELASVLELEKAGLPAGKLAHYCSAYGGINFIEFQSNGSIKVNPVSLRKNLLRQLEERLLLFYTGPASWLNLQVQKQKEALAKKDKNLLENLHRYKAVAQEMRHVLEHGKLEMLGQLLEESWELEKRVVPGASYRELEEVYNMAKKAGATGGKFSGTAESSYLLLYCEPSKQTNLIETLSSQGLRRVPFQFDNHGVHVFLDDPSDN
jgi:D-glycero-alpha-D-manno-heptose-7-phosphate kinase